MKTEAIIQQWMDKSSQTLADYDVEAHLNLISKNVKVHGVPELETIDYNDWARQVEHEFAERIVKSVQFNGHKIRAENATQLMFTTIETVTATDGTVVDNRLEVVLNKEADGQWRVLQERFLSDVEFAQYHYNLPFA